LKKLPAIHMTKAAAGKSATQGINAREPGTANRGCLWTIAPVKITKLKKGG
jgi:hypothetical protein